MDVRLGVSKSANIIKNSVSWREVRLIVKNLVV